MLLKKLCFHRYIVHLPDLMAAFFKSYEKRNLSRIKVESLYKKHWEWCAILCFFRFLLEGTRGTQRKQTPMIPIRVFI